MLEQCLKFHHRDFTLTRHDATRINAVFQSLLDGGKVTKDPVRERLFLTSRIMERLNTALLTDAIVNGTRSWDGTISDCLSLALQAALAARAGDIKRSGRYTGSEYIQWQDVEMLALGANAQSPGLKMVVAMRYRKNHK